MFVSTKCQCDTLSSGEAELATGQWAYRPDRHSQQSTSRPTGPIRCSVRHYCMSVYN